MTIHFAPSFLTVGKEYVDDQDAENIGNIFGAINEDFCDFGTGDGSGGPE